MDSEEASGAGIFIFTQFIVCNVWYYVTLTPYDIIPSAMHCHMLYCNSMNEQKDEAIKQIGLLE
jgi:hypothetical protein